jgi:hypothetical protein
MGTCNRCKRDIHPSELTESYGGYTYCVPCADLKWDVFCQDCGETLDDKGFCPVCIEHRNENA